MGGAAGSGATGGSSTDGGGAAGSGGAAGAGAAGGSCVWLDCLKGIGASPSCKPLATNCLGPGCDDVAQYASCVCSGQSACIYPTDPGSQAVIACVATDTTLAPLCLAVPSCAPVGKGCSAPVGECCPGLVCQDNVCS